ncbi:formate dehydrogenase subunit gamma [Herminiimonas fonticola]|uniref:Formate dehydrogenase gamma subunit n=1 Tax=Herminiimonas fonticola TaxID=303380 RepID=A0A4R6G6R9_9BURK|nr:formate dehydrogenase subunit gamma [Herminiimonas fonticola]RBA24260.1 formate-DH-gamm: formate dehydrogenase, gamma subunit [Herminiimonas fonticola]TDN90261.1 formate dehydrogenase gamma subunit [Herminiimonas fonticola]
MHTWFAKLAIGLSLLVATAGITSAQTNQTAANKAAESKAEATPPPAVQNMSNIQSDDILYMKQNQAERTQVQPGNLAPVYRQIKEGGEHYSSLPALEAGVLIQPKAQFPGQARATTAGEAWRQYRNGPLTTYGGWLIIVAVVGIAAFYLAVGTIKLKSGRTGRLIERFTSFERTAHWTVAISFLTLALTGLIMLFGKYVVLPVFGHTAFGWLAYACKNVHNFVGPVFTVALIVMFAIFVKDNFPAKADWQWLKNLGGARGHASAGRFNAGEKLWFWGGLVFLGLIVSASGFVLDMLVPGILYTRGNMQIANVIHLVGAVMVFSASLAHIYIGTLGMEGAFEAMSTGYVDDAWAKEHHDIWYQEIESGKVPRVRSEKSADKLGIPAKAV